METFPCPIWGENNLAEGIFIPETKTFKVENSLRAGGAYRISSRVVDQVKQMTNVQKARLTTWLIDQRVPGDDPPVVTEAVVKNSLNNRPLPVHKRADRLLSYIAKQSGTLGSVYKLGDVPGVRDPIDAAFAWSESTSMSEVNTLVKYLKYKTWVDADPLDDGAYHSVVMTVDGHARLEELVVNVDLAQAFVAMWFDDRMKDAYEKGMKPAVQEAGYTPLRIDQKEHINKIDDEIIAEIRRSRFLIADFTHGRDGARGGVYYESGFAHGLGLKVIFTCRKDFLKKLHFDTAHYNHILWTDPEDLREKLKNRILADIGEGPQAHVNQ